MNKNEQIYDEEIAPALLKIGQRCVGTGATKEAALEALAKDRKNLNDSLWA